MDERWINGEYWPTVEELERMTEDEREKALKDLPIPDQLRQSMLAELAEDDR